MVSRKQATLAQEVSSLMSFPDDTAFEFDVLVTSDYRVYQFGLDYLHKSVDQAVLTEWVDLTERHASSPYSEDVAEALEYLAESQGPQGPVMLLQLVEG